MLHSLLMLACQMMCKSCLLLLRRKLSIRRPQQHAQCDCLDVRGSHPLQPRTETALKRMRLGKGRIYITY